MIVFLFFVLTKSQIFFRTYYIGVEKTFQVIDLKKKKHTHTLQ